MNKKLSILLCIVLVLMTVLGGCGSANKNIRMGAGDIGGIYYSFPVRLPVYSTWITPPQK